MYDIGFTVHSSARVGQMPCLHEQTFAGQRTANGFAVSWQRYARQAAAMPAWADICRATDSEQLCCELPVVSRIG